MRRHSELYREGSQSEAEKPQPGCPDKVRADFRRHQFAHSRRAAPASGQFHDGNRASAETETFGTCHPLCPRKSPTANIWRSMSLRDLWSRLLTLNTVSIAESAPDLRPRESLL